MASSLFSLHFFLLLFLYQPLFSMANLHKTKNMILRSNHRSHLINTIPFNENSSTVYFEVTKPIKLPNTKPCSYHVLHHDFGFTYGRPPVVVNYTPPACYSQKFTKIVLEWKATCKGTQFDRIFGVWLSGVELLRGCTAEPTPKGIIWSVEKDITRYNSLLLKNQTQTLAVYLGNIVDQTYTGVYHVNLTFHFYPVECNVMINNDENKTSLNNLASNYYSKADLILPISQDRPLNDVYTKMPFHHVHVEESFRTFHLNFYADFTLQGEGSFIFVSNVTLGFNENKYKHGGLDFFISFLRNTQKAQSVIEVKNYSTTKRLRGTKQVYEYHGSDMCYSRNISSSNNLIEYDEVGKLCDDFEVKSVKKAF
ncbi:hypothetical protein GOBAR_DD06612 [Gossypium barbadense]|nr:hypothetical protein GOBAR_DD06612 [Gossypium barbadense]